VNNSPLFLAVDAADEKAQQLGYADMMEVHSNGSDEHKNLVQDEFMKVVKAYSGKAVGRTPSMNIKSTESLL